MLDEGTGPPPPGIEPDRYWYTSKLVKKSWLPQDPSRSGISPTGPPPPTPARPCAPAKKNQIFNYSVDIVLMF